MARIGIPDSRPPAQAPARLDPARFAREGSRLTGSVSAVQLSRVSEMLFDGSGAVDYRVEGMLSGKEKPQLHVGLAIDIVVACQRCMERLPIRVDVERKLLLSPGLDELASMEGEEDDVDAIPLVPVLDVLDLIDQEVMLALPIAPRHAGGECEARAADDT